MKLQALKIAVHGDAAMHGLLMGLHLSSVQHHPGWLNEHGKSPSLSLSLEHHFEKSSTLTEQPLECQQATSFSGSASGQAGHCGICIRLLSLPIMQPEMAGACSGNRSPCSILKSTARWFSNQDISLAA